MVVMILRTISFMRCRVTPFGSTQIVLGTVRYKIDVNLFLNLDKK